MFFIKYFIYLIFSSSSTWIADIQHVCNSHAGTMPGQIIKGFIQRLDVSPDFCMTLQCETQLDAIHRVAECHRFLQVDVTGGLVKITKHMNRHYGPVSDLFYQKCLI